MEIQSYQQDQIEVVSIQGSIDAITAGEVTDFFLKQISNGQVRLVMDLSGVDFMSSSGLRAILVVLKESRKQGGDLRLCSAQMGVERVLKMAGFSSILKAFDSLDDAARSYKE
jgi:anti-anti-sigma factor